MQTSIRRGIFAVFAIIFSFSISCLWAQSNSGTITGTVTDPTGAVVAGASVTLKNPVSGLERTVKTDTSGLFQFTNLPFNSYHLVAAAPGFGSVHQEASVASPVPISVKFTLNVEGSSTTINVDAGDLISNNSTFQTNVDRDLFTKLPLESQSSSLSSLVTLSTPGVAADSNGLFHGLGDHAENSFSVDGQPITDQQSKVFSNQIPTNSLESLSVISGAPPAEFGGKTSLVIVATTRSGQGVTTPHGDVTASYGTFGTGNVSGDLAYGGTKWGNFISVDGLNTGRFLDPPEFTVIHDKGNELNLFDRVDYSITDADSIHLNGGYSRSWFQNPNSFDQQYHYGLTNPITGNPLGVSDQKSKIETFNIAPSYTHLLSTSALFTFGAYVRRDNYNYYPSKDPYNDWSPDFQSQTISQNRTLTNAGLRTDITYAKGIHTFKAGATYQQTFLNENENIGIVDPTFLPTVGAFYGCLDANGNAVAPPCTDLAPHDLTIPGGTLFNFNGHTDVKELALYVQDSIKVKNWSFNLGIRGDLYNGLSIGRQAEPRVGVAYKVDRSNTILRLSYARTLESPFNENLVIGSEGCGIPFLAALVPPLGVPCNLGAIAPGFRNEFHAGLQQALGKYLVVDGEYIWKYTHNGYDFGIVGSTPITYPIEWHNSKIPGYAIRLSVPTVHGFTAFAVMSGVSARFFQPQVAGLPVVPPPSGPGLPFRIDHDERFNQTTHLQYQVPGKRSPYVAFNWRYDSGLVAGATPCYEPTTATCAGSSFNFNGQQYVALINTISGLPLTADQQFQAGFICAGQTATPTTQIGISLPGAPANVCLASQFGSSLIKVPAPNTEQDDHNPQRIQQRNLFDASIGQDNLFNGDKRKWSLRLTAVNITNKYALYNFLSTFSGTHYVTPRAMTVELGFHF